MADKTWTLTDVAQGQYVSGIEITNKDLGGSLSPFSIRKSTLRGGRSEGVDVIHVDNGKLRFDVLPTRGMSLWKMWLGELEIGWRSPVRGPVHPAWVPVAEPSGLGWLDGFDELLVRCGLESNGAPEFDEKDRVRYPLHGRIGNLPAHQVRVSVDDQGRITITGVVEEVRFHFLKLRLTSVITTTVGQSGLDIHDTIENLSASPAEAQLLYHVNFGAPLLDAGSQVVAPIKEVVPRNAHAASGIGGWSSYAAERPGFEEQVYFLNLAADKQGATRALLKNGHGTQGISLRLNRNELPCFTVWKNTTALEDGYVTGLEPGTNYPNPRSFEGEQGRVAKLAGRASRQFHLGLDIHGSAAEVTAAQSAVEALQAGTTPVVHDKPQAGWCADA